MVSFYTFLEISVAIAVHATENYPITEPSLEGLYGLQARKTEAIIRKLVRGGIVKSIRGHYGGYYVTSPETITLLEIYKIFEKSSTKQKIIFSPLKEVIKGFYYNAQKHYEDYLATFTLADIIKQCDKDKLPKREEIALTYYI